MKNRRMESLRRAILGYRRRCRDEECFEGGISARHLYFGDTSLSWWDDVTILYEKYRVAVAWQHPRMKYQDRIEDVAMAANNHLYSDKEMFADELVNYRRVGRRRRKVSSITTGKLGNDAWFEAVQAEEARLASEANFTIEPFFKVTWTAWSRFVSICAPVEVRNIEELRELAELVRKLLAGKTSLAIEFPGYVYTRDDWIADGLADRPLGVHAMPLAV